MRIFTNFITLVTLMFCCTCVQSQCLVDSVFIKSILIDPSGSTNSYDTNGDGQINSNDEFVEICYMGTDSIDLSGWKIGDDDPLPFPDYQLPQGTFLNSGFCLLLVANYCPNVPIDSCSTPYGYLNMGIQTNGLLGNSGDVVMISNDSISCSIVYGNASCSTVDTLDIPGFNVNDCTSWGIDIDGCPLLQVGDSCAYTPNVLPVDYLNFYAHLVEKKMIELNWSTILETNSIGFFVEWTPNLTTQFTEIGFVTNKNGDKEVMHYTFSHEKPLIGNNFYRLKQADFDGKFTYSNTEVVHINSDVEFRVFPIPSSNIVNISNSEELLGIKLYDLSGRIKKVFPSKGLSQIDISNLENGYYILRLESQSGVIYRKIIKS